MKSILFVNFEYPPVGAGAATATRHIAAAMAGRGVRSSVLTAAYRSCRGRSVEDGVTVYRIPALRRRAGSSSVFLMLVYLASAILHLPYVMRRTRPDALVVFFGFPCGPVGLLARLLWKTPYALMLRGGDVPGFEPKVLLLHRLLTPLRRTVYRASAAIAANSEGLRDLAVRADPGFPIRVIPNGVDSDFYRPSPLPKEAGAAFTFLFAGRFCDQKNIGRLLEAFAICRAKLPGARLTLVGEGSAARPLEALARDLDIGGALQWVAWSTKEDLLSRYRSSDCFVNPSKTEGMSNAVLEAMACGLPVLCGDCMGNREVVMNGENGFLFDPGDSGELARRMVALGKNRQWSLTLGAAGRRLCCERFSWARAADAVAAMLTGGAAGK